MSSFAQDSIPEPVINKTPLKFDPANTFDLVIQRDFALGMGDADTASLRGAGSWFVGLGFKIPLAQNRYGFRITPGFNWLKINYDHTDANKQFPIIADTVISTQYPDLSTIEDSAQRATALAQLNALAAILSNVDYELQRHRLTYLEVPIGFYYNFSRDEKLRSEAFIEAGGIIAFNLSNVFKFRYQNRQDQSVLSRVNEVPDVEQFRFGWYARAGYRKFAATFSYRNSYIFGFEKNAGRHYFPQIHMGLTYML